MKHKLGSAFALTTVLGLMAAGIAVASTPGPAYLSVASWKAASKNKSTVALSVTTKAPIPRHPDAFIRSNPVVGFAWVDAQTNKAFVATIHPVLGRDSNQNPHGWHAHTVTLTSGVTSPDDVGLGAITSSPTLRPSIHRSTLRI